MYSDYFHDQEEDVKKMLNITKRTNLFALAKRKSGLPYSVGTCVTLRQAQDDF